MKKIKFVNDQEPNISAETLNELQDNVEAGVKEEAEIATDEALTRKVVSYKNVLVDEQALIKECGGLKLKKLNKLEGKTEQEVREGYNLIPTSVDAWEQNGISGTDGTNIADGSYYNIRIRMKEYFPMTIDKYYIYLDNTETDVRIANIYYYDSNKNYITSQNIIDGLAPYTEIIFTPPANTAFYRALFYKADKVSNISYQEIKTIRPMLVKGTEKKPFEEYGKSPTPNFPSEVKTVTGNVEVSVSNENLFIPELKVDDTNIQAHDANITLIDDEYTLVSTGTDVYFGVAGVQDADYIKTRGRLYNVKGKSKIYIYITNDLFKANYITAYDSNKKSLGFTAIRSNKGSYDIPENAEYITFRFGTGNNATVGETYKTKVMLSFEEISEYKKHEGQVYLLTLGDIELCKIGDYADYLYEDDSKWFKRSYIGKYIVTGDETITKADEGFWFKVSDMTKNTLYCNQYKNSNNYSTFMAEDYIIGILYGGTDTKKQVYIRNKDYTTADEFKAYLKALYEAGTPVIIYYVLATPTDTEITDTTLIEQLNALENAQLYEGITNISITGDNLTPIADLDYWTWFKGESGQDLTEDLYVFDVSVSLDDGEITTLLPEGYTIDNSVIIAVAHKKISNGNSRLEYVQLSAFVYLEETTVDEVERCNCVVSPDESGTDWRVVVKKIS